MKQLSGQTRVLSTTPMGLRSRCTGLSVTAVFPIAIIMTSKKKYLFPSYYLNFSIHVLECPHTLAWSFPGLEWQLDLMGFCRKRMRRFGPSVFWPSLDHKEAASFPKGLMRADALRSLIRGSELLFVNSSSLHPHLVDQPAADWNIAAEANAFVRRAVLMPVQLKRLICHLQDKRSGCFYTDHICFHLHPPELVSMRHICGFGWTRPHPQQYSIYAMTANQMSRCLLVMDA